MGKSILNNKIYLYLTEFFAGMAVMAVELGASRLLAPYFSSSQIVWTIIIGTIMIAMALGNLWGGRQADKNPNPDRLYKRIIIAAVWIAAIPVLGKYIIIGISALLVFTVSNNFLIIAAFVSCMVIFVFPLFLLGTVTPSLVKYTVGSLEDNGKIVGNLGACNTIGSIIGTFMPTFVTIPAVGTAVTFLIFSGILLLIGLIYFIAEWRRDGKVDATNSAIGDLTSGKSRKHQIKCCVLAVVLFVACGILGNSNSFAFWQSNLVYEGESIYNYLQVSENDRSVILSTNVLFGVQSVYMKDDSLTGMYYDYALAAPVLAGYPTSDSQGTASDPFEILVLGMGSGTYATQCKKYFPNSNIEGVEIDQKITNLAHQYFELPEDIQVTTYDGRAYLQGTDKKYDVIMVDAYQDITIPFQMSTAEFFDEVSDHLTDNGVMVVNMNMHTQDEGNINQYLTDTISSVFENVYTVDVSGNSNRELFAFKTEAALQHLDETQQSAELQKQIDKVAYNLQKSEKGDYILTDDKAPVELLGMRVIDSLINEEVGYYKDILAEDGIEGLISQLM